MQKQSSNYTHRNRQVNIPDGYLVVGLVVGVHGLKGELKIEPHTDFPERFAPEKIFYLGDQLEKIQIQKSRQHKNNILVTIENSQSRAQAEELRGNWLFVPEDEAIELDEDTYWIHDIIGLRVETETERLLGTVQDVLFTGANEVYIVKPAPDVNNGKELLIPAIAQVIQNVDLATNTLTVNLPLGLLEEE